MKKLCFLLLISNLFFFLTGCGVKGPPLPPENSTDSSVESDEDSR